MSGIEKESLERYRANAEAGYHQPPTITLSLLSELERLREVEEAGSDLVILLDYYLRGVPDAPARSVAAIKRYGASTVFRYARQIAEGHDTADPLRFFRENEERGDLTPPFSR